MVDTKDNRVEVAAASGGKSAGARRGTPSVGGVVNSSLKEVAFVARW
jgi:hypothetical protein